MPGRILLMDNKADVLAKWGKLLEGDGYTVLRAATLAEAEEIMNSEWIQLAILDQRMLDEDDENDISGLLLAKKPEFDAVPKIILTAYPGYKLARQAMAPDGRGQRAALSYIAKDEGPQALRQAIEKAFAEQIRVNWDLGIQWDQRHALFFIYLVSLLAPGLPSGVLTSRAAELEDLFRRIFYDFRQVRVGRLLWHSGGQICLATLAQTPGGATDAYILVCGERNQIAQGFERVTELAPNLVPGPRLNGTAETMHFGALTYALSNVDIETVKLLREAFEGSQALALKKAFDHLLQDVLAAWHRRGDWLEDEQDLMSLYRERLGLVGLAHSEIAPRVEALLQATRSLGAVEIRRGADRTITFYYRGRAPMSCPDPLARVYAAEDRPSESVVCKVSPGRLTAENVLIDAQHQTWLTDVARAGQAPQWWDFICLEAAIRFELCQAPDLLALLDFEDCLTEPDTLLDRLAGQDVVPSLRTHVTLIEQIRRQVGSEVGHDPKPYYAGLLAWVVRAMADYDPDGLYTQSERLKGAHLLLAAGLLAKRLGEEIRSAPPEGALRLEADGTVWIGHSCVGNLVGQELALLGLLIEREGQIVSRQELVEVVFKEAYVPGDQYQDTRVNTLVGRLRKDIEPDPKHPRYVLTVRGQGYRLGPAAEPGTSSP